MLNIEWNKECQSLKWQKYLCFSLLFCRLCGEMLFVWCYHIEGISIRFYVKFFCFLLSFVRLNRLYHSIHSNLWWHVVCGSLQMLLVSKRTITITKTVLSTSIRCRIHKWTIFCTVIDRFRDTEGLFLCIY